MTYAPEELISEVIIFTWLCKPKGGRSTEIGIYYIKSGEVEATLLLNKKERPLKLNYF